MIREGTISKLSVRGLLDKAKVLYELDDDYRASGVTDAGYTTFSIDGPVGNKTVSVYAFLHDPGWSSKYGLAEQHAEVMDRLRGLYRAVTDAVPEDAPAARVDEVIVRVTPSDRMIPAEGKWPTTLVGHLTGDAAAQALSLLPPGPIGWFEIDGVLHSVTIEPVLPLLRNVNASWPQGGVPQHPAALAYNMPDNPHRFFGVDRKEVVSWFRNAMAKEGWRLAKEEKERLQVWVRERHHNDPIIHLHFETDHYDVQQQLNIAGLPGHPSGAWDWCETPCQIVKGGSLSETRDWFAEYLGYLGWEDGPFLFQRNRVNGLGQIELRLEYREVEGGIAVVPHERIVLPPPPPGWPILPTPEPPVRLR